MSDLIESKEGWLTDRIYHYAGARDYLKQTSRGKEEWRKSLAVLSGAVLSYLNGQEWIGELGPEDDYTQGPLADFIAAEVKRQRQRGGSANLFLGLLKSYRQGYLDLIHQAGFIPYEKYLCSLLINRIFDRLEMAGWAAWSNASPPENGGSDKSPEANRGEGASRPNLPEKDPVRLRSRYEVILNSARAGIIEMDLNGDVTFANPAAAGMLGYEVEELLGRHGHSTWHHTNPDGTPHTEEESCLYKALQVGEVLHSQAGVFWRQDGTHFPVEYAAIPLIEDGKFTGAVLTFWDITTRHQAEEALQDRDERLRRLLETVPGGIAITNGRGSITFANPAAEMILGLQRSDDPQKVYQDSRWRFTRLDGQPVHRDELPCCLVMRTGEAVYHLEYAVVLPDGTQTLVSLNAAPLRNGGDAIIGVVVSLNDVTGQRQMVNALEESEAKYRELVENANSIILRLDPQGRITFFNEFAQRFFGYSQEEILGQNAVGTIVPEMDSTGQDLRARILDLVRHPERYAANDYENMRRSGERVWVSWTNKAILDHSGKIREILCVGNDITDLRRAEAALRESEARFRLAFDNANVGMTLVGLDGRHLLVNQELADMVGYLPEELQGMSVQETTHPEDLNASRDFIQRALAEEMSGAKFEKRHVHKSGRTVWTEVSSTLVRDEQGVPLYFISMVQDITARREAEDNLLRYKDHLESLVVERTQALSRVNQGLKQEIAEHQKTEQFLKESEARFRAIFEGAPIGISLRAQGGRVLAINPALEKILGCSLEEYNQMGWSFLHPDDVDRTRSLFRDLVEGRRDDFEMENRAFHQDGRLVWGRVHVSKIKVKDDQTWFVLTLIEDITLEKQVQAELNAYQERLRALAAELTLTEARERRRLAKDLHDNIGQTLALLQIKLGSLKQELPLPKAAADLDEARNLLTQIIRTTRSLTLEMGFSILHELGFEHGLEWLGEKYQEQCGLQVEVACEPLPACLDDNKKTILFQAVQELLTNVVKHAQAKHAKITVRREGEYLKLMVSDDGIGFKVSNLTEVAGFGLFSIAEQVSNLGGQLNIDSALGKGAQVTISLSLK